MNPYKMIIYLLMGYVPLVSYSSDSLIINEFMASNISCQLNPENSDFEDWIELYNSGSTAIELGGLFLTDDLSDPFKWQLPGDARIQPGSYFIVWADGAGEDNHATFKLSADGEEIGLFYPDGRVIDTVTYGVQRNDISFGRFPDGGSNWQYFSKPSFSSSNNVPGLSSGSQAARPGFSPEGGLFSGPQMITLHSNPGTTICFTTDGAAPTLASSKYFEPIIVDRSTVIRARVYHDNTLPSDIVTYSYVIDEPSSLPVISIATPPEFLFDEEIGITTGICVSDELGAPPPFDPHANFWKKWERPVHIEYFTPEGHPGFRQDAGIAIFGGFFGRQIRQKAFTLYARDKYGDSDFDFPLFPTKAINSYERFLLRCSSNDFNRTYIRDAMMNTLVIGQMDIDYQAYQPAMVYINGNFWGLYNIREKINQYYPQINYGIDADLVDLIEGINATAHGDGTHYKDMITFIANNDMSTPENYEYIKTRMDMTEFMNYFITEIYVCNHDWLHQNIRCWREHSDEGKWRWLLYDMDWGFNGEDPMGSDQSNDNTFQWALNQGQASTLFRQLNTNKEFREEFAQRFVTHLNLTFAPERIHRIISDMAERIAPELPRQIERWGAIKSMEYWNDQLNTLHHFAEERPRHLTEYLSETIMPKEKTELILEISNPEAGWISVYDVPVAVPVFTGQWYREIPLRIKAHARDGWRFTEWVGSYPSYSKELSINLRETTILHAAFEKYDTPPVVISEIHYNPSAELQGDDEDFEFVELVNMHESRVHISGYQFTSGIEFTFPAGTYMDAGEYIILAANSSRYANKGFQVFQVSSGKLDNAGEELVLTNNMGVIVDQVSYDDHYPWPEKPDGEGPSLELKDPFLDNNLASSWKASEKAGGTPGAGKLTGIDDGHHPVNEYKLFTVRPNPFNRITSIRFSVPEGERISLRIFNSFGQEVGYPAGIDRNPGNHEIYWAPGNLPAGIYFIQVSCGGYCQTEKVVYLKP